jgi:uncharacterized protein YbaP (TraB family)
MELDASSLMESMSKFLFKIVSITGEKLSDKLPPDLYKKVKEKLLPSEVFADAGFPLTEEYIDMFTPLGIAALLQLKNLKKYLSLDKYEDVDGIDKYFLRLATENNIPIYEAESISFQLEMLFSMFELLADDINSYLEAMLDSDEDTDEDTDIDIEFDKLLTAWKVGDDDTIDKMMNDNAMSNLNDEQYKAIMDALLYNRNINIAKKIEEYLTSDETYFIVIGAGHYVGKKSIIDILQQTNKYNIKRL